MLACVLPLAAARARAGPCADQPGAAPRAGGAHPRRQRRAAADRQPGAARQPRAGRPRRGRAGRARRLARARPGAAAVDPRSRRARRLALHLGIDRAAQGRDAEPRQSVARRGQRRALSRARRRRPHACACSRWRSTMARTSCSRPGHAGGCAIGFDYLLPRDVVRAVGRHDVTVLAGVPPLWLQLAEQDWGGAGTSLRTLTNSGGHLPEPLVRRLRDAVPAGEAPPDVRPHRSLPLVQPRPGPGRRASRQRRHAPSRSPSCAIVRPDGSEAAPGEEGELVHSGPLVAKAIGTTRCAPPSASATAKSGRATRWSIGADGLLRFRGRDDAMIKVSGNRISPTEIEEAALASGAVRDAAAFGVPDERTRPGDRPGRGRRRATRPRRCAPISSASSRRTCSPRGSSGATRSRRPERQARPRRARRPTLDEADRADPAGLCGRRERALADRRASTPRRWSRRRGHAAVRL